MQVHRRLGEDAMEDIKAHLQILRDQVEFFTKLSHEFKVVVAHVETVLNVSAAPDTFLGRKTYEPFPQEME
jgi:hypothetical protein